MNNLTVEKICYMEFNKYPGEINRFEIGLGNYVYRICFGQDKFVIRITQDRNAYKRTSYWLNILKSLELPIPKVICMGEYEEASYIILNHLDGDDLGNVYTELSEKQKKVIAKEHVRIQNKVASLPENQGYGYLSSYEDESYKNSWKEVILTHLERSRGRIKEKEIFDYIKVDQIEKLLYKYDDYLASIRPIPFLDDITTKNVLINKGRLSGVIDIDWLCFGDKLYTVALTNMALISAGYDTSYIDYLIKENKGSDKEKEIIKLYTIIFLVDFMSEKGMKFNKAVPISVSENEVTRFNELYEKMYGELTSSGS